MSRLSQTEVILVVIALAAGFFIIAPLIGGWLFG